MIESDEMSDVELCEAVTREVLGAEQPSDTQRAFGNSGLELNWSGIGQVFEAMQERWFHHELITEPEIGHVSTFTFLGSDEVREGSGDPRDAGDYIRNPARAVFEAALKTVRAVDGDES